MPVSEPVFHERSHGESFLHLVAARSRYPGLWILDEPESALSFTGSLALIRHQQDILDAGGSQVILSTHSPILASLPGAAIYEVGPWGYRPGAWEDPDLVHDWRSWRPRSATCGTCSDPGQPMATGRDRHPLSPTAGPQFCRNVVTYATVSAGLTPSSRSRST